MAWVTPPSFASGDVLTASNLNVISADIEYLNGYISGQNPAMASTVLTVDGEARYIIRHTQRYLHGVYLCQDDFKVYYSLDNATWTLVYHDGAPNGTVNDSISPVVDLDTFSLTYGALYFVKCLMDSGTVHYLYESDSNA